MKYILRFVQQYRPSERQRFLELETQFQSLERSCAGLPRGRRLQPVVGSNATNTLIWEAEFPTLDAVERGLGAIESNPVHGELFRAQSPFILNVYSEILEVLEF